MPYDALKGLLTDIGTEELGHLEMVGSIVHQLTRTLTEEQMKEQGFAPYFVDHTAGVYPQAASGTPWSAATMAVTGDPMAVPGRGYGSRAEGARDVRQHPAAQ